MPILKQLVSNSAHSKRRSRADLTAEMISAPLGDFRHTMHVGRAGDAFGDTSFLTSKAGEPVPEVGEEPGASKPSLLSRRFRSSKRSQSVTRGDRRDMLGSLRDSALFVKNAVSLPQLNEKDVDRSTGQLPKSLSSSPVKKLPEEMSPEEQQQQQQRPNGAAAGPLSPALDERDFGDITDLPVLVAKGGAGLKHAESIMSFHIDLGPSMLGDVLSIMDKDQWEQDEDPEAEESREEEEEEEEEEEGEPAPPGSPLVAVAAPPGQSPARGTGGRSPRDSSPASSCTSGPEERSPVPRPPSQRGVAPKRPDKEFSFADEDDDEIRV
ncbi:BORG4 protein, partial [Sylvia atricapilla]|nr:BORG4 protein [Sylvia atricapilla]